MWKHALRERGWSISDIAKHLGRDRKTVRAYLNGERVPGQRRPGEDPFARFEPYVRARFADDPRIQASTLYDELAALGLDRSYQTFTRLLRARGLRPACPKCLAVGGAGRVIRTPDQRDALEAAVMATAAKASGGRRCRRKTHRPPGEQANRPQPSCAPSTTTTTW